VNRIWSRKQPAFAAGAFPDGARSRPFYRARARGEESGLSDEEIAFYDALAENESARQVMGEPTLRVIAHELVISIKNSVSVDWMHREATRARMRVLVKRLLRKYGYPPDLQDAAVQNVLQQAEKTCGLSISDHIDKVPGMTVTTTRLYKASCRLLLPFDGADKETVRFEAGPTAGQASYRVEFNPSKLSKAGLDDLMVFLTSIIDPDPLEFFRGGRITRCDVAIDLPGFHLEDIIVRTSRMQKHGVYADRHGQVQSTYLGTPRSSRVVAYEKPLEGSLLTRLRLERRLKPRCYGYEVAKLKNPFTKVMLLPADFLEGCGIGIPSQFIADSFRIGGLNRALLPLDPAQRKALRKAYKGAVSLLPNLDEAWAAWPGVLIGCGLGKELGATPLMPLGSGIGIGSNSLSPALGFGHHDEVCS
jgi:Type I restriction enzyme HindI endonuclease subunit-like, C-terminal